MVMRILKVVKKLQWQLDLMSSGDQTAPSAGQEVL